MAPITFPKRARLLAGAALALIAPPLRAATAYERQVLIALNTLRADPAAYADNLLRYRSNYRGRVIHLPGSNNNIITTEGIAPLDGAVALLRGRGRLSLLSPSGLLSEAAADHVRYQAERGLTGHFEGAVTPADRLHAHGGGGTMTEVIAYGAFSAEDVIRQLMIDDGVADRGHRLALLDPNLRFAGVSCGPHRTFRTMCVIDMSPFWNGGGRLRYEDYQAERARRFRLDR